MTRAPFPTARLDSDRHEVGPGSRTVSACYGQAPRGPPLLTPKALGSRHPSGTRAPALQAGGKGTRRAWPGEAARCRGHDHQPARPPVTGLWRAGGDVASHSGVSGGHADTPGGGCKRGVWLSHTPRIGGGMAWTPELETIPTPIPIGKQMHPVRAGGGLGRVLRVGKGAGPGQQAWDAPSMGRQGGSGTTAATDGGARGQNSGGALGTASKWETGGTVLAAIQRRKLIPEGGDKAANPPQIAR